VQLIAQHSIAGMRGMRKRPTERILIWRPKAHLSNQALFFLSYCPFSAVCSSAGFQVASGKFDTATPAEGQAKKCVVLLQSSPALRDPENRDTAQNSCQR